MLLIHCRAQRNDARYKLAAMQQRRNTCTWLISGSSTICLWDELSQVRVTSSSLQDPDLKIYAAGRVLLNLNMWIVPEHSTDEIIRCAQGN